METLSLWMIYNATFLIGQKADLYSCVQNASVFRIVEFLSFNWEIKKAQVNSYSLIKIRLLNLVVTYQNVTNEFRSDGIS